MTDKIIDEVMELISVLVDECDSHFFSTAKRLDKTEAIRAKLREVLERKPLSDTGVNLMAHNLDEGDWDSLVNRNCWLEGFQQGFREAEKHHQIGAE